VRGARLEALALEVLVEQRAQLGIVIDQKDLGHRNPHFHFYHAAARKFALFTNLYSADRRALIKPGLVGTGGYSYVS